MTIFLDTNIILDFLLKREPFYCDADRIVKFCLAKNNTGCIAAHTILNIFYILRKLYSNEERRKLLIYICNLFEVIEIDKAKLLSAINNNSFTDFEDCVQYECSKQIKADYIVTRNKKDFYNSTISVLEPKEILSIVEK